MKKLDADDVEAGGGGDGGYVMAAALSALLAMSLVAAALVTVSINELRRVRASEDAAAADALLDAAIVRAASEIARDPRRRIISFEGGGGEMRIGEADVTVRVGWESEKLDVNTADAGAVRAALLGGAVSQSDAADIVERMTDIRAHGQVRLIDDMAPPGHVASECAHRLLTVFGGRAEPSATSSLPAVGDDNRAAPFARPPPGARLFIRAALDGGVRARGREAVVLITGDPRAPALVMDVRRVRDVRQEVCDDTTEQG